MNLYINPQNVSWKVKPTSDELSTYTIINYGVSGDPSVNGLYYVNQTGLVIKDASTNGNPISTAGLYYAQCTNNPDRIGVKLLVVRKFFHFWSKVFLRRHRSPVLNWWAADLCLVGRDQGWELRIFLYESRVTIHEKVSSL